MADMPKVNPDVARVIYTEDEIREHIRATGAAITRDYAGDDLVLICVLRGAAIFMADLARTIDLPIEMDFMAVSSYGSAAKSSGVVRILKDLNTDIHGRNVIVAEDILDTGITLKYLLKNLNSRGPRSLEVAVLFEKDGKKEVDLDCKYPGLVVPDAFVVGYGLDYAEKYRNLPYLGELKRSIYAPVQGD